MNISIIGSGNVAWFMATRWQNAGHRIVDVCSRHMENARMLAQAVKANICLHPEQLSTVAEVFLFALPDNILAEHISGFPFTGKLLLHAAGTQPLPASNTENYGVIWPLFSLHKDNLPLSFDIPVFWEAAGNEAEKTVPELASALSDNCHQADWGTRVQLHLSAVFVNNFVNHLMAITQRRMANLSLPFNDSLQPIIQQTIATALAGQSGENQTGPAIRQDTLTMDKHLQLLSAHPEWQDIYQAISQSIQIFYSSKPDKKS